MAFTSWMICPKGFPSPLISIHAPRTGSDRTKLCYNAGQTNFNPRSPHGERREAAAALRRGAEFQSTLPARGATLGARRHGRRPHNFNPRSPHGERPPAVSRNTHPRKFQSTLPARGATRASSVAAVAAGISTHAPRTGSDRRVLPCVPAVRHFNPRSPHGERRTPCHQPSRQRAISIHAPRTGSDAAPARTRRRKANFNPRSPHGERLDGVEHGAR